MERDIFNIENEKYHVEIGKDHRTSDKRFALVVKSIKPVLDNFGVACKNLTLENLAKELAQFVYGKNSNLVEIVNGSLSEKLHRLTHEELENLAKSHYGIRGYLECLLMETASQKYQGGIKDYLCRTSPSL